MSNKPLDPSGHLTLAVSNLRESRRFYGDLFRQLGFKQISEVAWVTQEGFGIWIKRAKYARPRYKHFAPGIHHLCFKARTKGIIDKIHKNLVAKKVFIFNAPEFYPEYTSKYYAVFFADPDGIKIEIAYY